MAKFDELVIWKGMTPYTGAAFTPPVTADNTAVAPYDSDGTVVTTPITAGSPDSPLISLCADIVDISHVDFRITTQYKISELYTWLTSAQSQTYYVAGQWTQNPDGTILSGGNYWCIYLRVNADYTIDAIFEVYDNGVLVTQLVHRTDIAYNDMVGGVATVDTTGWSEGWVTIAVERHNDVVALWTSDSSTERTGTETVGVLEDFTTPTGDLQVNGTIGGTDGGEYYSVAAEKNLRIWTSFTAVLAGGEALDGKEVTLSEDFFNLGTHACMVFFPRMYPVIRVGDDGDMRMFQSGFYPRINSSIIVAGRITAALPFPLTMNPQMAFLGTLQPGLTLYKPPLTISFYGFVEVRGTLNVQLPALTVDTEGAVSAEGTLQFSIPAFVPSLLGYDDCNGALEVNVPHYKFDGVAVINEVGTLEVTLPALKMGGESLQNAVGVLTLQIPHYGMALSGLLSIEGVMSATLPSLLINFFSTASDDVYDSMVMNLKNEALTLYSNYKFNSACQFKGKPFGATKTGIFDLNKGNTDDGTLIEWNIKTGLLDLEQIVKRKLRQAWLSYKTSGDIMFTIVLPDGTEYEYSLTGIDTTETGLRVKFGKGIRTKYLALDIENIDGSSFALDELKLHFQNTRSVR